MNRYGRRRLSISCGVRCIIQHVSAVCMMRTTPIIKRNGVATSAEKFARIKSANSIRIPVKKITGNPWRSLCSAAQ